MMIPAKRITGGAQTNLVRITAQSFLLGMLLATFVVGTSVAAEEREPRVIPVKMREPSGLAWHPLRQSLLVISDEGQLAEFDRLGEHEVHFDDTPIELHERDLIDRLERSSDQAMTLQSAFQGQNASQRIGLFLATLELTRTRRVAVRQDDAALLARLDEALDDLRRRGELRRLEGQYGLAPASR